jgi:hypothetical protein
MCAWHRRTTFHPSLAQSPFGPFRSRSSARAVNISFITRAITTIDKNGAADAVAEMIEVQAIR